MQAKGRGKDMKRASILLADDHVMLLDALVKLLGQEFEVVGVAQDGGAMLEMARRLQPDIVLLDISMPQLNGIDAARILRKEANPAKILFLSMYSDQPLVEEAFRAGASGYLLKSSGTEELVKAIQCVARGGKYVTPFLGDLISTLLTAGPDQKCRAATLTSRQREVLRLLAEGLTMKEIGQLLNITTRTTESHKYEIMRNLGVKTTAELIRYAIRNNLVQPAEPYAAPVPLPLPKAS
jgi:DNA-binding NarL/FixJ family response regulator